MNNNGSVSISTKSWHYIWMKFVLGTKLSPTAKTMHNLCPYFWLLIFSIIISPVVLPIKLIVSMVKGANNAITNFMMNSWIMPNAVAWKDGIQDLEAISILRMESDLGFWYKKAFDYDRSDMVYGWWKTTYGKDCIDDKGRYSPEFIEWKSVWDVELNKILDTKSEASQLKASETRKKKQRFEDKMVGFRSRVEARWIMITEYFQSLNNIIKWTKRTVGLIITVIGLVCTFVLTSFIAKGFLYLVSIWTFQGTLTGGIGAIGIITVIAIFFLIIKWTEVIKEKGLSLWYVKAVYWPIYILIFWPLKIIFQYLIWELILLNLFYLFVGGGKSLWIGILGFMGIFGEYFGASYSDVCPGLDWKEENKKE